MAKENQLVKWVPAPDQTCVWEFKKSQSKTPDRFYFPLMPQGEIDWLLRSKTSTGVMWKCPDGLGVHQLQSDGFFIRDAKVAYVIIWFFRTLKDKTFYYIEIDEFLQEKARSVRKPLTEKRAGEICAYKKTRG